MLESPRNFNQFSFFFPYFFSSLPSPLPVWAFICLVSPQALQLSDQFVEFLGPVSFTSFSSLGNLMSVKRGWLITTKFLLQTMPFSPSMHKPQAATFPWAAAAPVGRAPGPRQWVQLLSRAQSLSFVFLLSIPLFAVLRTVYFKCRYQINSKFWMGV